VRILTGWALCYFPEVYTFLRAAQRARAASDIFLRAAADILRLGLTVATLLSTLFTGAPSRLLRTERALSTRANSLQSRICSCFN